MTRQLDLPLYIDWWGQNFGCIRAFLPSGRHNGFALRFELVHKVIHLLPSGTELQGLAGSAGSAKRKS